MIDRNDPNFFAILNRFHLAWKTAAPKIRDFLPPESDPSRKSILFELVMIDLTRRWQLNSVDSSTGDAVDQHFPVLPIIEDYVSQFPELAPAESLPDELIVEEYRVRHIWGDRPSHEQFLNRFRTHSDRLMPALIMADSDMALDATLDITSNRSEEIGCKKVLSDETQIYSDVKDGVHNSSISLETEKPIRQKIEATVFNERYQVVSQLGKGGMGVVMLGVDLRLGRKVAIKLIRNRHWNSDAREFMKSEFENEAKIAAGLIHTSIAAIHDYGIHQGIPYAVFELVRGESLKERIAKHGPYPLEDVQDVIGQLAVALDYAHRKGIVHRDLKPDNVRFDEQGKPKILDFGLAKDFRKHTVWGFSGTPAYASPEQAKEQPSDGRSDQYALALIAYEMLTAKRPFEAKTWKEMLEAHREQEVVWPKDAFVKPSNATKEIIEKALSKQPNNRFNTCSEFAIALGCRIQTQHAIENRFELEAPAELIREGFFSNPAFLGLRGNELWICCRERMIVIDISKLKSATSEIKRPPGIWGKDLLGRASHSGPNFQKTVFLKKHRYGPWWKRLFSDLPKGTSCLTMRTASIAETWSNAFQKIIHESANGTEGNTEIAREMIPPILVKGAPTGSTQILGTYSAVEDSPATAKLKLMLHAAAVGANGIIEFREERFIEEIGSSSKATGIAIKTLDFTTQKEFLLREYARRCQYTGLAIVVFVLATLFWRIGLLEILQATGFSVMGLSLKTTLILYSVPVIFGGLLAAVAKWPQIIRPLGIYTVAWSWIVLLLGIGLASGYLNQNAAGEAFHEKIGNVRSYRKLEGLIAASGMMIASNLFLSRKLPTTIKRRQTRLGPRLVSWFAWSIAVFSIVAPIWAIGWSLRVEPEKENTKATQLETIETRVEMLGIQLARQSHSDEAARLALDLRNSKGVTGRQLCSVARIYCLCALYITPAKGTDLSASQKEQMDQWIRNAISALEEAIAKGYACTETQEDPDFDILRDRSEYQTLILKSN